jgi:type III secretion system YscQ/HrcQ family protein
MSAPRMAGGGRWPRFAAADADRSLLWAGTLAGLPPRFEFELGSLGRVAVVLGGPVGDPPWSSEQVAFTLTRGRSSGTLWLEAALARRVLDLVFGGPSPVARLSYGERGVLAGLLAGAFERAGVDAMIGLPAGGQEFPSAREGEVVFAMAVTVGAAVGRAVVAAPRAWIVEAAGASSGIDAAAADLPIAARIEIGRTRLPGADWAAVVPGDAVLFTGVAAVTASPQASWPVEIAIGDHAASAEVAPDGRITLTAAFRQRRAGGDSSSARPAAASTAAASAAAASAKELAMPDPASSVVDVTAVLAHAPIEVVAELGRVTLRGAELAGLRPGSVLAVGCDRAAAVTLRVADALWAEGELVEIDGELGVRVTRLLRDSAPTPPAR